MISLRIFLGGIFVILTALFLIEYYVVGQAVYGDGRYYWAFTRSMYFHQSFDISDAMMHFYNPISNNTPISLAEQNAKGYDSDILIGEFSLGISFFWVPFFVVADGVGVVLSMIGIPIIRNGYSHAYQLLVGIGNIGFIITGLYVLYQMLKKYFTSSIVYLTLVTLVFGTNLFYYGSLDVINSHPFSFMMAAIVIGAFLQFIEKKQLKYFFLQALGVGMLSANRSQDMIYSLVPIITLVYVICSMKKWDVSLLGKMCFVGIVGAIVGYAPQILLLSVSEQRLAFFPHIEDRSLLQAFDFLHPHIFEVVFNTKTGLLYYGWVLIAAFAGLFFFAKKKSIRQAQDKKFIGYVFLGIAFLQLYLISSWISWDQAASYGIRMLISSIPLLAFGLAEVLSRLEKKFSLLFVITICSISILHQMGMILGFKLFLQDPTNVGAELSQSGKVKHAIIHLLNSFF